jgi:hypothetical protein
MQAFSYFRGSLYAALSLFLLQGSVTTVNDELRAGSVLTGVGTEVDDSTLQIRGVGHSSHWDSVEPLVSQNGVGIKNDCRSAHVLEGHGNKNAPLVKLVRTYPGEIQLTRILF